MKSFNYANFFSIFFRLIAVAGMEPGSGCIISEQCGPGIQLHKIDSQYFANEIRFSSLAIALITVGAKAVTAALANPVKSLRTE